MMNNFYSMTRTAVYTLAKVWAIVGLLSYLVSIGSVLYMPIRGYQGITGWVTVLLTLGVSGLLGQTFLILSLLFFLLSGAIRKFVE